MSNALAIATVTETLLQQLSGALGGANVAGAQVTALRPDSATLPNPGVNIFLFQVLPNISFRNSDLPTRRADGTLLRRPQVALDLHYLLTFYGDDSTLEQQRLLGAVARKLHANPVLQRSDIQLAQSSVTFLNGSDLASQVELVRFTPIHFSVEELSKLWSVFLKTDYVLSVAYVASVVLIETDDVPPPPPLPVLASNLYVLPFAQPVIMQIISAVGGGAPILPGSQIVLIGRNFLPSPVSASSPLAGIRIVIGQNQLAPDSASSSQVMVTLPPGLPAGGQTVQVVQLLQIGTPPAPHTAGFQSDLAAFVLHPAIRPGSVPGTFQISVQQEAGSPPVSVLTATIDPTVQPGQRALLELITAGSPQAVLLFDAGPITSATNSVSFSLTLAGQGVAPGQYLVRVRINGAESSLALDPSGNPIGPMITL
jgi:Pvc16 N-terminal domain